VNVIVRALTMWVAGSVVVTPIIAQLLKRRIQPAYVPVRRRG
jgi:hypothetical protein